MEIDIDIQLDKLIAALRSATESNRRIFESKTDTTKNKKSIADKIDQEAILASQNAFQLQSAAAGKAFGTNSGGTADLKKKNLAHTGLFGRGRGPDHNIVGHAITNLFDGTPWFEPTKTVWRENIAGNGKSMINFKDVWELPNYPQDPTAGESIPRSSYHFLLPAGKNPLGESEIVIVQKRNVGTVPSQINEKFSAYLATNTNVKSIPVPSSFRQLDNAVITVSATSDITLFVSAFEYLATQVGGVGGGSGTTRVPIQHLNQWGWDMLDQEEAAKRPTDFARYGYSDGEDNNPSNPVIGYRPLTYFLDPNSLHQVGPAMIFWLEQYMKDGYPIIDGDLTTKMDPRLDTFSPDVYYEGAVLTAMHNWRKIDSVLKDYTTMPWVMRNKASWASWDLQKENSLVRRWAQKATYSNSAPSLDRFPGIISSDYYLCVNGEGWDVNTRSRVGSYPKVNEFYDQSENIVFNSLVYDSWWWENRNLGFETDRYGPNVFDYKWGVLHGPKDAKPLKTHYTVETGNIMQSRQDPTTIYYQYDNLLIDRFPNAFWPAPFYVSDAGWPSECRKACRRLGFTLS